MIKINNKKQFEEISVTLNTRKIKGVERDTLAFTLKNTNYAAIDAAFVDDIKIILLKEKEGFFQKNIEQDCSVFCVAGDIIDHRDGTYTVCMGKKTPYDLAQERVAALEKENAEMLFQNLTGEDFEE